MARKEKSVSAEVQTIVKFAELQLELNSFR